MGKMVQQLADLALGALPTMAILVFLYVFLKAIFFNPLDKILKARHAATEGSQQQAKLSIAAAEAKAAEYAAALEKARTEVLRGREATRQAALKARAEMVEKARLAAHERIQDARIAIESDVSAARATLGDQSRAIADSITRAILR